MDNFEFCARLHQASWPGGSPVIMVFTQSDARSVVRALTLGVGDYISGLFGRESLPRVIANVSHHD
jgi:PleD family two-component response regulator